VSSGGGSQAAIDITTDLVSGTVAKLSWSAAANSFNQALNGVAATRDTSGSMPVTPTTFRFGYQALSADYQGAFMVYQCVVLPRAMDDTELAAVTA
jgi:hypothetical protein